MQRKVGNLGNMVRTMGYIHRALLVNTGRVQNLGGVAYENFNEWGRLHINVITKRKDIVT